VPVHALRRALLVAALCAVAGCGGGDSSKGDKATPTATATKTATAKSGGGKSKGGGKVDVKRFNLARLRVANACRKLKDSPRDKEAQRRLRQGATVYLAEFKTAPDTEFKRNDKAPKVTMRRMLVVTAAYLRASCGSGKAKTYARQMSRAAHKRS
jgi:hypothetical protein